MRPSPTTTPWSGALSQGCRTLAQEMLTVVKNSHAVGRVILAGVLALAGLALVPAAPAQAADNGRWSVFPVKGENNLTPRQFFILDAAPGATIRDTATIENVTDQPIRLRIYPADAFNTPIGGGFALKKESDEQTDVGSWMTVGRTQVTVPAARPRRAGEDGPAIVPGKVSVPMRIDVPSSAAPGDHAGGFVTVEEATRASQDQTGLQVRQANAVRVYLRVAGPTNPQLLVSSMSFSNKEPRPVPLVGPSGSATLNYTIANTGNVRITPQTTLTMKGLLGQTIATQPLSVPEILPGQQVQLSDPVTTMPALDRVNARMEFSTPLFPDFSGGGETATWSISWIFVLILVLVIGAATAYWVRRQRQRRASEGAGPAGPTDTNVSVPA